MRKPIIILGTGGSSLDLLDTLYTLNGLGTEAGYDCLGFLDDDEHKWGREYLGVRVLGPLSAAPELPENTRFVNGIGSPGNFWRKQALIAQTQLPHERFETIVHPSASVSTTARLGCGTVILQHATIT
jgi:FlaA1/EpsC-like NDP-sugar epimerase